MFSSGYTRRCFFSKEGRLVRNVEPQSQSRQREHRFREHLFVHQIDPAVEPKSERRILSPKP